MPKWPKCEWRTCWQNSLTTNGVMSQWIDHDLWIDDVFIQDRVRSWGHTKEVIQEKPCVISLQFFFKQPSPALGWDRWNIYYMNPLLINSFKIDQQLYLINLATGILPVSALMVQWWVAWRQVGPGFFASSGPLNWVVSTRPEHVSRGSAICLPTLRTFKRLSGMSGDAVTSWPTRSCCHLH